MSDTDFITVSSQIRLEFLCVWVCVHSSVTQVGNLDVPLTPPSSFILPLDIVTVPLLSVPATTALFRPL